MSLLTLDWTLSDANAASLPAIMKTSKGTRLIYGTGDGNVVALDESQQEVWRSELEGAVTCQPSIDDISGAGTCVLVGTEAGDVACLSGDGAILWKTRLEGSIDSFNNIAVVQGADISFVVSQRTGVVTGLSGDGEPVWEFQTHQERIFTSTGVGTCAVGDLDGDGVDEIVFSASDGHLYCIGADGGFRWNVYIGTNSQFSGHVMADLGNGPCVISGGTGDVLRAIDADGKVMWEQRGVGAGFIEMGISVGDINGDGVDEVVFVHQGRAIQAVDGDGEIMWSSMDYVGGDQPCGPAIGDITGDGKPELLLTQRLGKHLRVIGADGSLLEEHDMPDGVSGSPIIADVDGDGQPEVLLVSAKDNSVSCYSTGAPATSAAPWPTYRGAFDGRMNRLASVAPIASVDQIVPRAKTVVADATLARTESGPLQLGMNTVAYDLETPDTLVEIRATGPDGVSKTAVTDTLERTSLKLDALGVGTYALVANLIDAENGTRTGTATESIMIGLFSIESAEATSLLDELAGVELDDGDTARTVGRIQELLSLRWGAAQTRIARYDALSMDDRRRLIEEVATLLSEMRREVVCWKARQAAEAESNSACEYITWSLDHPWQPLNEQTDAPTDGLLQGIDIRTDQRGHDAIALQIANVSDESLGVRLWFDPVECTDDVTHTATDHFTLRRVTQVPTPSGGMGADSLPEIGNSGVITIAPSSSVRIWIDVTTHDLPTGDYTSVLHMRALSQPGTLQDVPVSWTVLPVALPEAMPLKFCNWGYLARSFNHALDIALEDMQDHHTSIFTGLPVPRVTYNSDGDIVEKSSWDELDWYLDRMRPQNVVTLNAYPLAPVDDDGPARYSDAWKKAFATFLPEWTAHLAAKGFGYDRWAFYPVDEPGLHGGILIQELERYARFVKGLDPKVQIYTDPYRGMTVEDHKRMVDVVDIVQPTQYFVILAEQTDRIDYLMTTDQTHWIYEARAGVKDDITPTYYWEQIWTAWEIGFTGVGYWTYCTTGFDLWEAACDYVMVYQGAEGPVPSVRWQAIRIGIEDHARLVRLRDAIGTAKQSGRDDEAALAESRLAEVVVEAKAVLWNPGVMAQIRREVVDMTMSLLAK
jgi:hypothetical protein